MTPQKPMRIITLAEREAVALSERRSAIAEAQKRLAAEAPLHNGRYLVFGSAARGDIHARSDLDLLAEFPRANVARRRCSRQRGFAAHWASPATFSTRPAVTPSSCHMRCRAPGGWDEFPEVGSRQA